MEEVTTVSRIEELLGGEEPTLILKHSTQCPISAAAHEEVRRFADEADIPVAVVHVIEHRGVSDHITGQTGITHESPQTLLVQRDRVLWDADHRDITVDALRTAVERLA